jgi:hypothetical protein
MPLARPVSTLKQRLSGHGAGAAHRHTISARRKQRIYSVQPTIHKFKTPEEAGPVAAHKVCRAYIAHMHQSQNLCWTCRQPQQCHWTEDRGTCATGREPVDSTRVFTLSIEQRMQVGCVLI